MSVVGTHFVYLDLAREKEDVSGTRLMTRGLGRFATAGEIRIAIDSDGRRLLLVPVGGVDIDEDNSSKGVRLSLRELVVGGANERFLALTCMIKELDLVFESLAEDVVARVEGSPDAAYDTCRSVLAEWRALLRTAAGELSLETVVGLVGELEVVRRLAEHSPTSALAVWRGPDRTVHDFVRGVAEIEVKATASVDGASIEISNIAQLDPSLVDELYLVVVHLIADGAAPSLDERIDELIALGIPKSDLLERIQRAGYVYESRPTIHDRYAVRSVRGWRVRDDFPGLRAADIPEERRSGVSRIRYRLDLGSTPPRMSDTDMDGFFAGWGGAAT